jgi:molybdopterin/thiamine biosynthesis adenylyltransferase
MTRYARQQILPEVGPSGQKALQKAHVLVVGAGGLGCPVLQYLVGAGIGQITLIDADTVSLSNLHRQILFRETDVDQPKAQVAARTLSTLNRDSAITPIVAQLTPDNAADLVAQADIVLDCADSFAVSYTLSDSCFTQDTPLISASALGLAGYVGGFCGGAPSLRAIFPDLPQRAASCATAGVLGPVVGTIGALQAQMGLNTLLGLTPSPLGQLINLDLHGLRTSGFRFDGAPEPDTLLEFISVGAIEGSEFIVDLRGTDEAPELAHALAQRKTVEDFKTSNAPHPKPDQRAILICRSGLRAWQAARHLQSYWSGPISLIALGDTSQPETPHITRSKNQKAHT